VTEDLMKFLAFASEKSGLNLEIINALTIEEFTRVLDGKTISLDEAKKRLDGCALVKKNNIWVFEVGKEYLEWKNKIMSTQSKEIKGQTAYPGKAIGKVVIHQSWTGTIPLREGDVLVTGMTNPHMIPYIRKAAAIVTDEGGITCHAAIISREMKKPCIVGTKNATLLLRDGMKVEVDADTGVVRIING
jgi:phosphoenolpyruvate synthase/pyruvate phosphate dikinase